MGMGEKIDPSLGEGCMLSQWGLPSTFFENFGLNAGIF